MELQTIGRYQLLSEIARGGMATVYLAMDPRFEREVAIKVLPRVFMDDPTFRARFSREAKLFAALDHPAIVQVYDFGEENGQPYLVMRLMKGGPLADRMKQGSLELLEVLRVLRRIASALDHAHDLGIVHRDIKPSNVLFDQYQDAFLSDFGISRQPDSELTQTGVMSIGTPGYMSPEQIEGNQVDRRSDVYALGIMCYEMLAGKRMYKANTPTMMVVRQMTQPPPLLGETSPALGKFQPVIDRALAKDPAQRFGKASEFVQALVLLAQPQVEQATIIGMPPFSVPLPSPTPEKLSPALIETEKKEPAVAVSRATVIEPAPEEPPSEPEPSLTHEPAAFESPLSQEEPTDVKAPEATTPTEESDEEPVVAPIKPAIDELKAEIQEPVAWNVMATVVSARPVEVEEFLKNKAAPQPIEEVALPKPEPVPPEEPISPYEVATQVDMAPIVMPKALAEEPPTMVGEFLPVPPIEPVSPFEASTQVDMAPIVMPKPSFDEPVTFVGEAAAAPPVEPVSPFEASTQVDMAPIVMPKPSFDEPATWVGEAAIVPPIEPVSPFEASTQVDMAPIVMPKPSFDEPVTFVGKAAAVPPIEPVSPFEASTQVDMAPITPGKEPPVESGQKPADRKKPKAAAPSRMPSRPAKKANPLVILGVIGLVMLAAACVLFWLFSGEFISSTNCLFDPGGGLLFVTSPYSGSVRIDGRISSPLEWSRAYCVDMKLLEKREGPFTRTARWWIKNDEQWLYFLVRVPKDVPVRGVFVYYFWPKYENGRWQHSDGMVVTTAGEFDDVHGWDETQWFSDDSADPPGMNDVEGAAHEDSQYWWFEFKKPLDSRERYDWSWRTGMTIGSLEMDHFLLGLWTGESGFSRYLQLRISTKP